MPSLQPSERLVVDANPFWSILTRKSAFKIVTSQRVSEIVVAKWDLASSSIRPGEVLTYWFDPMM